jgi:hypothetical protein
MSTPSPRRCAAAIAVGALLGLPVTALAAHRHQHDAPPSALLKSYDMNAATGDYAPPINPAPPSR